MKRTATICILILAFSTCYATKREETKISVIKSYLEQLHNKNAKNILQLFTDDGIVTSTSKGRLSANTFFTGFLPELAVAEVNLRQIYHAIGNDNRYSARFYLTYKLKDGETGSGEYMDDFYFDGNSNKLKQVDMFENLKLDRQFE